jgi:hypothetical protein
MARPERARIGVGTACQAVRRDPFAVVSRRMTGAPYLIAAAQDWRIGDLIPAHPNRTRTLNPNRTRIGCLENEKEKE